ncbi:RNA polymerase sigma factor [Tenacibaculum xiamenense]|uniref:RNA polymerase sigma factor n=1 Tax=Tenacibaculum xiamenense TaxID=1261553 RepID=UPI0038B604DF
MEGKLWRQFINGEYQAFDFLYKQYHSKMYKFGIRYCKNEELVKDCVQEVFMYIYDSKNNKKVPDNVGAYLNKCLRNLIFKKMESEKRQWSCLDNVVSTMFLIDCCEKEQILLEDREKKKQKMNQALSMLTNDQKQLLLLKYCEGVSYREISKALKIKEDSAKKQVYRLLKRIRIKTG